MNVLDHFFNIKPILKKEGIKLPKIKGPNGQKITKDDLCKIFPCKLVEDEFNESEEQIPIPEELVNLFKKFRPTLLSRAYGLEKHFKTKFPIFYKREDLTLTGSHKINTAIVQAYYAKQDKVNLVTETGAGQWGTALAVAGSLIGIKVVAFMVRISYQQKPYRRIAMRFYGAKVIPSPSKKTEIGRSFLKSPNNRNGSLGIAISEAIEYVLKSEGRFKYALGSVLDSVLLHQTIIGLETLEQLKGANYKVGAVIGCVGGGSNFAGFSLPILAAKIKGRKHYKDTEFYAIEPEAVPTLTKGRYEYDYGDSGGLTPKLKMYTLGYKFVPDPIHAGGLRYHGMAPLISLLYRKRLIKAVSIKQKEAFDAAKLFARVEGIIPAPESSHAIAGAIRLIKKYKSLGEKKTIIFNLSGHGLLDLKAYE